MKIFVLAAFVLAVALARSNNDQDNDEQSQWPWKVGTLYRYNVETQTLAYHQEGASTGTSYRARVTVRVKAPGRLEARLENPEYAQVHQELQRNEPVPKDLKYKPAPKLDKPFEIYMAGGRVKTLRLSSSVPLAQENFIKGLIGALQVDLSTYRNVHSSHDTYDKNIRQGLFRKMETDVTGDCETLYSVSPVAAEWRRELPEFESEEEPFEITKSKNYGHCHHRVDYHFGVPEVAEWTGTAHSTKKEQFINRATVSRILAGKEGPIYKAETTSTINVNPHLFGKQRSEVQSKVSLRLVSYGQDNEAEWPKLVGPREILNLLYSLTPKQISIDDSSSSNSEESFEKNIHVEKYQRERRSARPKTVVSIDKVIVKSHVSDEDSSSSSDSTSAYVNDEIPLDNEPAYAALYLNPQPHGDKKQNPMNAQKLVQEISHQLQNPNNMPKSDFLSKFNILVRVIASMSYGQLSQTSRSLEVAKSSNDIVKTDMWMIYRDAVAEAGTLPAFQQIRTWIEKKKIEGEEAAEVVAVLSRSLRYPTTNVMKQFFELAMSPVVTEQLYLNSSALISATRFINMGQVNNLTAHRYYPTHMYGRLSAKHDRFVVDEVLPRLSQELKSSIEREDSHKAQVYIRAIGNLGHRAIVDVFAPYLEGKITVSTYLRTRMVENLRVLAYQGDHHVRAVLFSILKNSAEPYEVRVAAVHNIIMTRPTTAMMQTMAEMTKVDPSTHVRAAIKSMIETVADLKSPRYFHVAKTAAAVKDMLTKETFGAQYSYKKAIQFFEDDDDLGINNFISNIGSKDSLFPKTFRYTWRDRIAGWNDDTSLSWAASSGRKVVDYFINKIFGDDEDRSAEINHKYSANKISDMLKINYDDKESLEASLYLDFLNEQRLFAFGENDMKELAGRWVEYLQKLTNGIDVHYTKVINRNEVSVMFPLASGMPFIYKYKEPAVLHVQGKVKGKVDFLDREDYKTAITLDKDIRVTYAENHDGSVGFFDTLGNQYAIAGLVRKFQLYIPLRMSLEMKPGEIKANIKPVEPEQDITLLHYSMWPYTANQKKDSLTTFSQDPTTQVITRPNKVVSIDYKFGQQVSSPFQIQGYSYSQDFRNIGKMLWSNDLMSSVISAFKQRDVAQTHFNLRHLGKQAKNKGVSLTAIYDTLYNQKNEGQMPKTASEMSDVTPNSPARREELIKRVTLGINAARATVLDLSAKFDTPQKQEYVLTAAVGDSHVDPKVQFALFAARNSDQPNQFNAVSTLKKPASISLMNFQEALQKELKMEFEADIRYNKKENIHIQGTTERTQKYVEELQKQPWAIECVQEIARGNYYQRACHQAILMAHAPDNFKFGVFFKDVNPAVNYAGYEVFKIAESLGLWKLEAVPNKMPREGKLDINVDLQYWTNTLNLALSHSFYGRMDIKNVPIPKVTPVALSTYWPIMPYERVLNYYSKHQFQPLCSVDNNKVRTFSDRDYDYKLSRSWHVVMLDDRPGSSEDLVVLARRPSENRQDIYISYSSHTGKHLEIEVQPPPEGQNEYIVQVKTNAKKVSQGALTTYWDDVDKIPILEYYKEGDNELILEIREGRLRVMYDGQRFTLLADERRNSNRGICGYMSGERRDDYLTPNGLIDRPEYYGASYALIDGDYDPKDKEQQAKAREEAYKPRKQFTAILKSDEEWNNQMRSVTEDQWGAEIIYRSRSYLKPTGRCDLKQQVQYYENSGEICISTSPLPACQSHCSGEEYKVQVAQVVCKSKFDEQFRSFRNLIRQGENPKVTGVPKSTQYRVPNSCKA